MATNNRNLIFRFIVAHTALTVFSTIASIICMPLLWGNHVALSIVETFVGNSVAVAVFSGGEPLGFIDPENCAVYLVAGILFELICIFLFLFLCKKKLWAIHCMVIMYVIDLIFFLVCSITLNGVYMIPFVFEWPYYIGCFAYKISGISLYISFLFLGTHNKSASD